MNITNWIKPNRIAKKLHTVIASVSWFCNRQNGKPTDGKIWLKLYNDDTEKFMRISMSLQEANILTDKLKRATKQLSDSQKSKNQ